MTGGEAEPAALRLRLDKWLWAARFFKTRTLAAAAVEGGKVRLNGAVVKPAKELRIGDLLDLTVGDQHWTLAVRGLDAMRRPAPEARLLYEEAAESRERRQRALDLRKLAPTPGADLKGRPSKRAGRLIRRLSEG
ncbi:MAG TPA: RNA-binding S4 domain-containing protein [Bradyrhizobium sp.]|nr:RNA-binding S4 domain-containing protein [Bradyrhizobium sp.]